MNPYFLFSIFALIFFYYIHSKIEQIQATQTQTRDTLKEQTATLQTIATKLEIKDSDRRAKLKLRLNDELFADISCGRCHNSESLPLPINNISLEEAIEITRLGNEESIKKGMPKYKSFNDGKNPFITESGLKNRLEKLYTKEFLDLKTEGK